MRYAILSLALIAAPAYADTIGLECPVNDKAASMGTVYTLTVDTEAASVRVSSVNNYGPVWQGREGSAVRITPTAIQYRVGAVAFEVDRVTGKLNDTFAQCHKVAAVVAPTLF